MSANARTEGEKLRRKYASNFKVPIEDVELDDRGWPDRYYVWAPRRPELPTWDTGDCP